MLLKRIFILLRLRGLERQLYKDLGRLLKLMSKPVQNFREFLLDYSYPHVTRLTAAPIYKVNAMSYFMKSKQKWIDDPNAEFLLAFLQNYRSNHLKIEITNSMFILQKTGNLNVNTAEEMLVSKMEFILKFIEDGRFSDLAFILNTLKINTNAFMLLEEKSMVFTFKINETTSDSKDRITIESTMYKEKLNPKDYRTSVS